MIPGTFDSEHKRGHLVLGGFLPPLGDVLFRPEVESGRELDRLAEVDLAVSHDQREFEFILVEVEFGGCSRK